jgi:hypothetical protein
MYVVKILNVKKVARELNRVVFDNKINLGQVEYSIEDDLDTELGYCIREDSDDVPILGLCAKYDDEQQFYDVLCHEMIHLYQYQVEGTEPDHGPVFRKFAKRAEDLCCSAV